MTLVIAGIGARKTPPEILTHMTAIGELIKGLGGYVRSGHAEGADHAFERGAKDHCLLYLPWVGFGPSDYYAPGQNAIVFDELSPDAKSLAYDSVDEYHPAPKKLHWQARKLLARNFFQIMGTSGQDPVKCVVCWAEPDGERYGAVKGGTGQGVRIARDHDIPVFNLYEVPPDQVKSWLSMVA